MGNTLKSDVPGEEIEASGEEQASNLSEIIQQGVAGFLNDINSALKELALKPLEGLNDGLKNARKEALKNYSLDQLMDKIVRETDRVVPFIYHFGKCNSEEAKKDLAIDMLTKEKLTRIEKTLLGFHKTYIDGKIKSFYMTPITEAFEVDGHIENIRNRECIFPFKVAFVVYMLAFDESLSSLVKNDGTIGGFKADDLSTYLKTMINIEEFGLKDDIKPEAKEILMEIFGKDIVQGYKDKYNEYMQKVVACGDDEMATMLEMTTEEKRDLILDLCWNYSGKEELKKGTNISRAISGLLEGKSLDNPKVGLRGGESKDNILSIFKDFNIPTTKQELEALIWEKLSYDTLPDELKIFYAFNYSKYQDTIEGRRKLLMALKDVDLEELKKDKFEKDIIDFYNDPENEDYRIAPPNNPNELRTGDKYAMMVEERGCQIIFMNGELYFMNTLAMISFLKELKESLKDSKKTIKDLNKGIISDAVNQEVD